jgi:CubicO group peptidase (beta-lactamase class C family)
MEITIQGEVATGFEAVKQTFQDLWLDVEVGASFCAYYQGEKVVDLWGGFTDPEMTQPWQADTLVNVYSTTKGMAALALAVLVDEGKINYADTVSQHWPEFGAAGKQNVTVAQMLSHQAGLCGIETRIEVADLYDWQKMTNLLALMATGRRHRLSRDHLGLFARRAHPPDHRQELGTILQRENRGAAECRLLYWPAKLRTSPLRGYDRAQSRPQATSTRPKGHRPATFCHSSTKPSHQPLS